MTEGSTSAREVLRDYHILSELERDANLSQRDLAEAAGLNLATINQILKRLVRKGYIKTSRINAKRLAYYLTPQGFSEKMRLVMRYTGLTIGFFTQVRTLVNQRLRELKQEHGVRSVAIVGTDELAEAVYLSAQECGLDLVAVYNGRTAGREWFGCPVLRLGDEQGVRADAIILTEFELPEQEMELLADRGEHLVDLRHLLSRQMTSFARRIHQER